MSAGPDPVSWADLRNAFVRAADEIGEYFAGLASTTFTDGDTEHWSPAHHLDHLIRSNLPVAGGLGVARGRLQPLPPEHQTRTYRQIRADYRAVLAGGARASGRWLPQPQGSQTELVERFRASLSAVNDALGGWPDAGLNAWAMPHPALGVLSVREMLLFTLMHNRHHADGVQARLGKVAPGTVSMDNASL
ncbi:DinB family protein [Deinococcus frigens]|uniref:DinB family protein n=1 Tax=Deinococcus frigens TaxID=249403 RepID=UPI000A07468A|nr:DinB family protein [Deinococcus frigens]